MGVGLICIIMFSWNSNSWTEMQYSLIQKFLQSFCGLPLDAAVSVDMLLEITSLFFF